jgi:formylglycine-generating enzyme required for sulfatase activity
MIVVPAGSFMMGSPPTEKKTSTSQAIFALVYGSPQHNVTIAKPFAVSKYELTFADWDACVAHRDCDPHIYAPWGRGKQPVINESWYDAQRYVAWLSKMTGKPYRLLSEAEYEYAARAGTTTRYPWGDDIKLNGKAMANCVGCGSKWDNRQAAPVGSFAPNRFGLYDMVANVYEWVEDCQHRNYQGAPTDGSAWVEGGDCSFRVVRGGPWIDEPDSLRSATRYYTHPDQGDSVIGFRLTRTLNSR